MKVLLSVLALLIAGGVGFGLGTMVHDPPVEAPATAATFTVTGSMTVVGNCSGGGYGDISEGAQVEILNQENRILAVGTLEVGTRCHFTFRVDDVPAGHTLYGASVGNANRGTIWKNEVEARGEGFALSLGG